MHSGQALVLGNIEIIVLLFNTHCCHSEIKILLVHKMAARGFSLVTGARVTTTRPEEELLIQPKFNAKKTRLLLYVLILLWHFNTVTLTGSCEKVT